MAAKPPSSTITVFIGSSSEGESHADGVKEVLERRPAKRAVKIVARTWPDVFAEYQSKTTIEVLLEVLDDYDFGVFVLSRDDVLLFRGDEVDSPRDNVVLEIGLFTGKFGRERTFFLVPDDFNLKLPSDLGSMVAGNYTDDETRYSAVRTAVMHAKALMLRKGLAPTEASKRAATSRGPIRQSRHRETALQPRSGCPRTGGPTPRAKADSSVWRDGRSNLACGSWP